MFASLKALFQTESLVQQAFEECNNMLDLDWKMFHASIESLRRTDSADVRIDIPDADKQINKSERDIRRKILTQLAISGSELSSGLAIASIVIDIERIGDYTKNIYELAQSHQAKLTAGPLEERVARVEAGVTGLFQRTTEAFRTRDEDSSRQIMIEYKETLANECQEIINDIVSGKVTEMTPANAAAVALYVRYLKRVAAHLRTIVTSVVNPFPRIGYKEKQIAS